MFKPITFCPSTVVITGVTRGLGRAMADEFIRRGHIVLGCARTRSQIDKLARLYPTHDFQTVDVASDREVSAWVRRLSRKYEPPTFVLNNAAILNMKASLWEVSDKDFSTAVDINIRGVVNVIRHFVPWMIPVKRGIILNFSSRWGTKFHSQLGPYCATKWAVVALTRTLAEELRSVGIAAIALNPGLVRTEMLRCYLGHEAHACFESFPTPEAWANVAVPLILRLRRKDTGRVCDLSSPVTSAN